MDRQDYLHLIERTIRNFSMYSHAKDAWTISVAHLKLSLQLYAEELPPGLPSVEEMLDEGARKGLWALVVGHESGLGIVFFK